MEQTIHQKSYPTLLKSTSQTKSAFMNKRTRNVQFEKQISNNVVVRRKTRKKFTKFELVDNTITIDTNENDFQEGFKGRRQNTRQTVKRGKKFMNSIDKEMENSFKLPFSLQNNPREAMKTILILLNSPVLSKSSMIKQYKCLMSNYYIHDSHLISKKIANMIKQKMKLLQKGLNYNFKYTQLAILIRKIQERSIDTEQLTKTYENLYNNHEYPISVKLMIMYMGSFIYSICGKYQKTEDMCKNMLNILIKYKLDEYIIIYLVLMIKAKTNQTEWRVAIGYLSKALAASWLYKIQNLEIWCYFQLSRCHFFLNEMQESQFFKLRNQLSVCEPKQTIFRAMMIDNYKKQIARMRQFTNQQGRYFHLTENIIEFDQLSEPKRQYQRFECSSPLKIQVYIKRIKENCKIGHVKNLRNRITQEIPKQSEYENQKSWLFNNHNMTGNPLFRTHESANKNINIYFRMKHNSRDKENISMYSLDNVNKNIVILKEMIRNIILEMKYFVGLTEV